MATAATAMERLARARKHAQEAADLAREAGVYLSRRRDRRRFDALVTELDLWACQQTAALTQLMNTLRTLEASG